MRLQSLQIVFTCALSLAGAGCVLPDYTGADGVCKQGSPWIRQIGSASIDIAFAASSDPCGGVTVGGGIQSTVKFGTEATLVADNKDLDGFVARFDGLGNNLWATLVGSSGQQFVSYVETDHFGNAVAAGSFVGTLSPGGSGAFTGEGDATASGSVTPDESDTREYSSFVTKLDLFGAPVWTRVFLGPKDMVSTTPCGLAVDRGGSITIAVNFMGQITIDGATLTGEGDSSIFVAHYDEDGGLLWKKAFSTPEGVECNSLAADKDGNILMTGAYRSDIDFGGGPLAAPTAKQQFFVLKMGSDGDHVFSDKSLSGDALSGTAITSDAKGNIFVAGSFFGQADFGDGAVTANGFLDVFVQKRSPAGERQWSKIFSPSTKNLDNIGAVTTIRADPSGNVLLGGTIVGELVLDQKLVAKSAADAFIARLNGSDGAPSVSRIFQAPGPQLLTGLAVDMEGFPIVASWFTQSIDLGPGAGQLTADDNGFGTLYVAKLKL